MKARATKQRGLGPAAPSKIEQVHFYVEEPSMEALLRKILPGLLPELPWDIFDLGSKTQLKAKLPRRLAAVASMARTYPTAVVVLVDRDDDDCASLKAELDRIASAANLVVETSTVQTFHVANRIVIEELEAWYFGDWDAVKKAYPRVDAAIPRKADFRDPDAIAGGTWERFSGIMQSAGYFPGGFAKIKAAQEIGQHMEPAKNRSASFQSLLRVVGKLERKRSTQAP